MPNTEPAHLTVAEVAQRLRISQESVRRWVREGRIPAVHTITGRVRISAEVADTLMVERPPDDTAGAA